METADGQTAFPNHPKKLAEPMQTAYNDACQRGPTAAG